MIDYKGMEKRLRDFVLDEYEAAKNHPDLCSPLNARAVAYGALQFGVNNLFPSYNKDLAEWWELEMYDKFTELI